MIARRLEVRAGAAAPRRRPRAARRLRAPGRRVRRGAARPGRPAAVRRGGPGGPLRPARPPPGLPRRGDPGVASSTGPPGRAAPAELALDLGENAPEHNDVEVELPGLDYRRQARLEGSDDGKEWRTLAEKNLIRFRVGDKEIDDRRIAYPPSRFRYLRVRVEPDPVVDDEGVRGRGRAGPAAGRGAGRIPRAAGADSARASRSGRMTAPARPG